MKKLLIGILIFFGMAFTSCEFSGKVIPRGIETETITVDNCQYICITRGVYAGYVTSITHKGNCNNPIHNKFKETEK